MMLLVIAFCIALGVLFWAWLCYKDAEKQMRMSNDESLWNRVYYEAFKSDRVDSKHSWF
ncbi:hypothetical protein [Ruminiclostridium josui]|uniref:hypothetical protein n=1 Tax=Ruminiclostridium josui TaxID=1499 RepID=UPI0004B60CB8|nr:hypothetical protein [Ruminiclostridium josui]